MTNLFFLDFLFLLPQVFAVVSVLTGLTLFSAYGSFTRSVGLSLQVQCIVFLLLSSVLFLLLLAPVAFFSSFGLFSSLLFSPFLNFYALLAILATTLTLLLYGSYTKDSDLVQFETPFFVIFTTLASIVIFFSNDFLIAYLGLELQALVLYILAASRVNSTYSTEAGLKYFVLGSFASCLLLLGISFLYGVVGTLNFTDLSLFFASSSELSSTYANACLLSLLLIVLGLLFKVGAAPFHFWVADVYTGSPIVITAFFAVVPKLAGWVLLLKLSTFVLSAFVDFFSILFVLTGLLSLLIGSFGAVSQSSLKRILAFSAVAHAGYLLLGIAAFQTVSLVSNALYLFVYTLSLLPIFAILIVYFPRNISSNAIDTVYGLRYLYKQNRVAALILVFSLFSAAGVPPLSGFFAKLYVFFAVVSANYITVAALALLLSSASAVYYLKVVRFAFFFRNFRTSLLLQEITRPAAYTIALLFVLNISFFAWGSDFLVALCQIQSNFLL